MESDSNLNGTQLQDFNVDPMYEFSAPHYFDFCKGESEEEAAAAERWFQPAFSYAASPCVAKLKSVRELSMGCSLEEYIEVQKLVARVSSEFPEERQTDAARCANPTNTTNTVNEETSVPSGQKCDTLKNKAHCPGGQNPSYPVELKSDSAAPGAPMKRNYSDLQKQAINVPSAAKITHNSISRNSKITAAKRCLVTNQNAEAGEQQARKKQKLEGGHSCQIWNSKTGLPLSKNVPTLTVPQEFHFNTEKRAQIHRETGQCSTSTKVEDPSSPFVSLAEKIQRFQLNISGDFRTSTPNSVKHMLSRNRMLTLTRPKEPELGTYLRARPPRVKSFVEQEEELLANLPKFRALPLNKRILEAPTLPFFPRTVPQLPEFQEFNLRTMERALIHHDAATRVQISDARGNKERVVSSEAEFHFETAARARPLKIASSRGLAMLPKFKARPLNKRIFSSRGDVGIFPVAKRQATKPQEFHFATDERAQFHDCVLGEQGNKMFSSLSLQARKGESSPRPAIAEALFLSTKCTLHERVQAERDVKGMTGFQTQPSPCNMPMHFTHRARKPLAEIQQFVFQAEAQVAGAGHFDKKYLDERKINVHQREQLAAGRKAVEDGAMIPFLQPRPTQHLVQPMTRPKDHKEPHKLSFPACHMR